MTLQLQSDVSLKPYNTFGVDVRARLFAEARTDEDVREALAYSAQNRIDLLVLGGGSNLLLTGDVDALVLRMASRGIRIVHEDCDRAIVEAENAISEAIVDMKVALARLEALPDVVANWRAEQGKYVPGFGHRFHNPVDPRAPALMAEVAKAVEAGVCDGRFAVIGQALEAHLAELRGRALPMNIDGATAVIYAELGFPAPLARGLFLLSRSVGILAHAWEQTEQGALAA